MSYKIRTEPFNLQWAGWTKTLIQIPLTFVQSSPICFCMQFARSFLISAMLLVAISASAADSFTVSEFSFEKPSDWKKVQPASSMRKAQLAIPSAAGADDGEVVFFYFGKGQGGGIRANLDRWIGQFKEPKDQLGIEEESKTVNGTKVTYLSAKGTLMTGRPFGPKTPKADSAMVAAILEGKEGSVFIKTTGPAKTVIGARDTLKAMIEKALK